MILRKKFGGIQEMYNIVSKLLIYGDMDEESILMQLSDIFRCMDEGSQTKDVLRTRVFKQVKRILEVATDYAFDKNLWHNYLTYLLITNENPFSITCEKVGASEGSVNHFAKSDFKAFKELFDFDFSRIEDELGVDCFSRISDYQAIGKPELMYNKNVSEKVQALSERLETAKDENEFFDMVTDFYKAYGVLTKHSVSKNVETTTSASVRSTTWIKSYYLTLLDMRFRNRNLLRIQKHL